MSFMSSGMLGSARNSLRVPHLEGLADADEQSEILDLPLAAHHRRNDDAAAAVVGHFLGRAERHHRAAGIIELGRGIGLLLLEQPLELGMLQRGVSGVVGAERGEAVMLGKDDGAGIAAALDHRRRKAGTETRPFASTAFKALPWNRCSNATTNSIDAAQLRRRQVHGITVRPWSVPTLKLCPALQSLLVTQQAAGYNGFSCHIRGFHAQARKTATFLHFLNDLFLFCS